MWMTYLAFEWLLRFKSLLCNDEVGDDGERGELNKWCDSIGSPCTGWWSSSIRSSIWLRLNVAASDTTSGIYLLKKTNNTFQWIWKHRYSMNMGDCKDFAICNCSQRIKNLWNNLRPMFLQIDSFFYSNRSKRIKVNATHLPDNI